MTEEIIIDGVNVAECEFYYEGECCQTNYKNEIFTKRCKCSDKLCYYKKLKRLEQENKHLNDLLNQALKEQEELRVALEEIKNLVKEISYLGSRGERELKFKIKNILEDVIDEEIY